VISFHFSAVRRDHRLRVDRTSLSDEYGTLVLRVASRVTPDAVDRQAQHLGQLITGESVIKWPAKLRIKFHLPRPPLPVHSALHWWSQTPARIWHWLSLTRASIGYVCWTSYTLIHLVVFHYNDIWTLPECHGCTLTWKWFIFPSSCRHLTHKFLDTTPVNKDVLSYQQNVQPTAGLAIGCSRLNTS